MSDDGARAAPEVVSRIRQVRARRAAAAEAVKGGWPEWERLTAEAVGTFFLVLVAAGAGVVAAVSRGEVSPAAQAVAPGAMVLALIYALGETSGAHLNPAVSVAFAARGDFPWRRVPGYVLAQLAGAFAAASLLRALFGTVGRLGATVPGPGVGDGAALVLEVVLTMGLVTVILGTASGARNIGHNAAIAVGGYVALAGLWAGPASGGSMNPARSLGPAVVSGSAGQVWIYLVGPLVGAVLAVPLAWILRGPHTAAAVLAAQGRRARLATERIDLGPVAGGEAEPSAVCPECGKPLD
ncbi:aquaporin Z [Kitasatospora sp. MAA4]|uniref:MIP/aquaporin family protein n=1 Tax=Kitasatospora sp. MAA4 TaxID=3035093 RepID=UPI0024758E0C|nr:aquaporin [Kitasatospora sp. MAA4]MDH6132265.1 aquaporin Z [Kitasatospora sp. MAA4]